MKHPSLRAFCGTLCMLVLCGATSLGATQQNGLDLITRSLAAPAHLAYIGEIESFRFSGRRELATIVRVEHRPPDATRRWYLAPPNLYGDSVVSQNHQLIEFDEHHHEVIVTRHPMADGDVRTRRLALISQNYRVVVGGKATIAGRSTTSVTLISRTTGHRAMRFWLDTQYDLPLERETYTADGSINFRMRFTSIRFIDSLPLSLFSTQAPAGFRIVHSDHLTMESDAFHVPNLHSTAPNTRRPEDIGSGFHLVGLRKAGRGEGNHLIYSDGVHTISLFEGSENEQPNFADTKVEHLELGNMKAEYLSHGDDGLLSWREGRKTFTLVGDTSRETLIAIGKRIMAAP